MSIVDKRWLVADLFDVWFPSVARRITLLLDYSPEGTDQFFRNMETICSDLDPHGYFIIWVSNRSIARIDVTTGYERHFGRIRFTACYFP